MMHRFSRPAVQARPLVLSVAVCAAWSIYSASALAQTSDDRKLEPVLVTATRTPQIAKEVLADNVTITSEEIAQSGQRTLVDLLQRQRGIEITRTGGPGNVSSVFIRGADNKQNIVLIDGVRTSSSTGGGASWSAIPLSQIDHIEIVYGPLSSLYGADALGGVVQIFTKQGDGKPVPTVSAGYGSYNTRSLEAGVSGAVAATGDAAKFRYAISAAHEASDGFSATKPGAFGYNPDKDGYQTDSVSGRLGAEWKKGQELGLSFLQSRLDVQFDNSPTFNDRSVQKLGTFALFSKNRITSNWLSNLQLSESTDQTDSFANSGKTFFNTRQTDINWQHDISLGSDVLQLVLENRKEKVDASTVALNRERSTDSIAAAYQLKRGAHLGTLSLRNDDNSQFGGVTTGSLAYGYRITGALRANASYGTSYRAPTFNDLYFPGFGNAANKPERGRNAEAGLYYDDGKTNASAVVYRNRVTDLIVTATPCPTTGTGSCAYNVNKALLTGVTIGAGSRFGDYSVRGSLDLQDPRDETTDRSLARRAQQHGTIGLDYAGGAVKVGGELVFSGRRYDDAANKNVLGGYGVMNLYANYEFAPNWTLFGRWNNVLDKNYELARNYATAGSNVFVGVRYGLR